MKVKTKFLYTFLLLSVCSLNIYGQSEIQNTVGSFWRVKGNSGTSGAVNFIGTTDNISFRLRTNNTEKMVVDSNGLVGIGTSIPSTRLHIAGTLRLVDGTQALNNVLMSDAFGNASWKPADSVVANFNFAAEWHTTGNSGINSSTNFVGTINSASLRFRTFNQQRMVIDSLGKVGIATGVPNTKLDIAGDLAYRESSVILSAGTLNNVSVANNSFFKIAHSSNTSITGFTGGFDGKVITLYNDASGTGTLSILNQNTGSIDSNRIVTGNGNLVLADSGSVTLQYSEAIDRWIVTAYSNGTLSGNTSGGWNLSGNSGTVAGTNFIGTIDSVDLVIKTENSERMRVKGNARVSIGVGSTAPFPQLDVYANTIADTLMFRARNNSNSGTTVQIGSLERFKDFSNTLDCNNNANTVLFSINLNSNASHDLQLAFDDAAKPGSNTWTVTSDERLKDEIHPFKDGLETIKEIKPVYFRYNGKGGMPTEDFYVGVLAQQLQKATPYMVGSTEYTPDPKNLEKREEYLTVNNGALTYVLVNAVQELDAKTQKLADANKSVTDFGVAAIRTGMDVPVLFSQEFEESLEPGQIPVVMATALNYPTPMSVKNITDKGFTISADVPVDSLSVNWIAIAKINKDNLNVQKDYTKEERKQMIDKVKIRKGVIRTKEEEQEAARRMKGE